MKMGQTTVQDQGLTPQTGRRWLSLILAIYLLLTLGYGSLNPLFEAPDEHHHYFTAQGIVDSGRLPSTNDDENVLARQEAAQPPLYYVLSALIIAPIDTAGAEEALWSNPFVRLGDANSPININAFVHGPEEAWPWQGHVLASHLIRVFSALLGLGTLICIYGSGRLVWPANPERALLATALVAFLPQYNFLHGSISNDTLVIFLSAAALWQLLAIWFKGISRPRLLALGLTIGLAALSKMAGLLLLPYAAGFLLLVAWRDDQARRWWRNLGKIIVFTVAPALIIAGWLLWRNWTLYDDFTATNEFIRLAGGDRHYSLLQVLGEMKGLWRSLFAVFGWLNVAPPGWIYLFWYGLAAAAVLGAVLGIVHLLRKETRNGKVQHNFNLTTFIHWPGLLALLMAIWVFLVYAGLVQFMLKTPAAQGRLMFPALVPLALGLVYGLSQFRIRWIYWLAPVLALVTTVYCLLVVIPNAYARPPILTDSEVPVDAVFWDTDLGQGLELVASRLETGSVEPGAWVWLTLYWRSGPPLDGTSSPPPEYVLELFGRDGKLVAKQQSYHGGGLFPAELWPPGAVIADRLGVRLLDVMDAPTKVTLNLKLAGETDSVDVGTIKVAPAEWPEKLEIPLAQIGGIELAEAELSGIIVTPGEEVMVDLRWQVTAAPGRDLTTFVHLGDPTKQPLSQADGAPLAGDYPTHLWSAGEIIDDSYRLTVPTGLPAGRYPIHVGLYDPATGVRLPLYVDDVRQAHDAYLVGWLTVEE